MFFLADSIIDAVGAATLGAVIGGIWVVIQIGDRLWKKKVTEQRTTMIPKCEVHSLDNELSEIARLNKETRHYNQETSRTLNSLIAVTRETQKTTELRHQMIMKELERIK